MKQVKALIAALVLAAAALVPGAPGALAQGDRVRARTVVTVLPKKNEAPRLTQQNIQVTADGKPSTITTFQPYSVDNAGLEFVVLIDDSARTSLGLQLKDLADFIQSMPPKAQVGVAYMRNGAADFSQPLTADHALAAKGLRLPIGTAGVSASPWFCLSDLAKRWPSQNRASRREVLMVTDGVDPYFPQFNPHDPYLEAAVRDSQRAGLNVFSIYFRDVSRVDHGLYETNAGQNLLNIATRATGGNAYWQGLSNPVSFKPFLEDLRRRLDHQYELGFTAPARRKQDLIDLKLRITGVSDKVTAPERVPVEQ